MSELQMRYEGNVDATIRVEVDQSGRVTIMHRQADDSWSGKGYPAGYWERIVEISAKGQRMAAMLKQEMDA